MSKLGKGIWIPVPERLEPKEAITRLRKALLDWHQEDMADSARLIDLETEAKKNFHMHLLNTGYEKALRMIDGEE